MKKIEAGNRKIYKMKNGSILLEVEGGIYILEGNKWIDDTGQLYRNVSSIDKALMEELDPGEKPKLKILEG